MFGVSVGVERTVGLLFNLAIVAALMVIARPWGRTATALAGVMGAIVVLTPIGLTALAWHGAVTFKEAEETVELESRDGRLWPVAPHTRRELRRYRLRRNRAVGMAQTHRWI